MQKRYYMARVLVRWSVVLGLLACFGANFSVLAPCLLVYFAASCVLRLIVLVVVSESV